MKIRLRGRSPLQVESEALSPDAVALIYELLDALDDTARLGEHLREDQNWEAHLDYLRALQRTGREMLARMPADEGRR
jgi:hypothetical protein